ncbi:ribonuclease P protein component [Hellea balneolensis]|uniref:ribonuclease P protein component n=1 Tax=Hellea balneolensis TaxID=287478 RepID=UPI0003F77595|nr:ribonuclease P protein component [Hellea balneolensis]
MNKLGKLGVLKKRSEFLFVREGRYQARGGIVIQARENPESQNIRVGFTATKKIGNAVIRNRAKRRMRSIALETLPELGRKGTDYVFIARNSTVSTPYETLVADAQKALSSLAQMTKTRKNKKQNG